MSEAICQTVCEYALDVGVPEYSGLRNKPEGCGNCAHYLAATPSPHADQRESAGGGEA